MLVALGAGDGESVCGGGGGGGGGGTERNCREEGKQW